VQRLRRCGGLFGGLGPGVKANAFILPLKPGCAARWVTRGAWPHTMVEGGQGASFG
jgi:hypothetical protein